MTFTQDVVLKWYLTYITFFIDVHVWMVKKCTNDVQISTMAGIHQSIYPFL